MKCKGGLEAAKQVHGLAAAADSSDAFSAD